MADSVDTTNTHLHKVLSHRNYMHYVALQKQLSIYDRQKKLVEKELLQISKVRSAVQQINRRLPKQSPTLKKRDIEINRSSENSKPNPTTRTECGKVVEKKKEGCIEQGIIPDGMIGNGKSGQSNVNEMTLLGSKNENIVLYSTQSPVTASTNNRVNNLPSPPPQSNHPSKISDTKVSQVVEERKLFTQRKRPYVKSCSAPQLPVQRLEEVVEIEKNEQCKVYRLPKSPTRMTNTDNHENSDENLYRKSLLANHANRANKDSQIRTDQCDGHVCLPKTPTSVTKDGGYENSDEDLRRKNPLNGHTNAETKFPALSYHQRTGCHSAEINNIHNPGKNLRGLESVQQIHRSSCIGSFPHTDFCLVQKSRSRTVYKLKTPKMKNAWNSPGTQRRRASNIRVHFPNNDVCVMDKTRTRAKTMCEMDSQFSEYGRPRSKTDSENINPGCQQGSAPEWLAENTRPRSMTVSGTSDYNWSKTGTTGIEYCRNLSTSRESLAITKEESIAIKGKFRQIGHSVLATALMKKMRKK